MAEFTDQELKRRIEQEAATFGRVTIDEIRKRPTVDLDEEPDHLPDADETIDHITVVDLHPNEQRDHMTLNKPILGAAAAVVLALLIAFALNRSSISVVADDGQQTTTTTIAYDGEAGPTTTVEPTTTQRQPPATFVAIPPPLIDSSLEDATSRARDVAAASPDAATAEQFREIVSNLPGNEFRLQIAASKTRDDEHDENGAQACARTTGLTNLSDLREAAEQWLSELSSRDLADNDITEWRNFLLHAVIVYCPERLDTL